MARVESFKKNPNAERYHTQGLIRANRPPHYMAQLKDAEHDYSIALRILTGEEHGLGYESRVLQSARVLRDYGFVIVREALRPRHLESRRTYMGDGLGRLVTSREMTEALKDLQPGHYSPDAWRHLRAENGATAGVLGRWNTAAMVTLGDSPVPALDMYEAAHDDLEHGDNRYYEVSNSKRAELHAVIEGRRWRSMVWRDRASSALKKAQQEGGLNYEAAQRTFARLEEVLKDPKEAKVHVRYRP